MSHWSEKLLAERAHHVAYEVVMLVDQARVLIDRYGCAGPMGSDKDPVSNALLDAVLVHLRLLDDFLRNGGWDTDIKASDWVPKWRPVQWLGPRVRERINWQVAHLSGLRETEHDWYLGESVLACCEQLSRFFDEVGRVSTDRLAEFLDADEKAREGVDEFAAVLSRESQLS